MQNPPQQPNKAEPAVNTAAPVLSWPGYGIMFFWQLGILQYLEENFDLSQCKMVGSSAGSMLSVLAACGVSAQDSLDLAHQLCIQHGVFKRPLGLMGVWGGIVREWLDILLPEDAAERCSGRVRIVITTLPLLQRDVVTSFKDRADLIDCCLASSHVPFLMDWQPAALCRGTRCVDGSLGYILTGRCSGLKPLADLSRLLLLDPFADKSLLRGCSVLRCVLLCGKDGAQQLLDQGFAHASTLDSAGRLKLLHPYRRVGAQLLPGGLASAAEAEDGAAVAVGCGRISRECSNSSWGSDVQGEEACAAAAELGAEGAGVGLIASSDSVCSSSGGGFAVDAVAVIAEGPDGGKVC